MEVWHMLIFGTPSQSSSFQVVLDELTIFSAHCIYLLLVKDAFLLIHV